MCALKLGSLFDGIGVFPLAASRNGIIPVWASEIEKSPIAITKRHFPDMEHLGILQRYTEGTSLLFTLLHSVLPARTCLKSESVRDWLEANQDCFFRLSEL